MQFDKRGVSAPFLLFACFAVAVGIYARFKGLGFAPVTPDEYYLARGIDGILKHGYPAYDCGGIYQRGLGLQYLIAAIRYTGLSVELSSRIVCAVASLAVLPAAYLVGRRFMSANAALLAVGLLALSVWEIEIARFGRMYAPFQAVFAWYLVYFLRHVIDGDQRALKGMMAMNVLGILIWEGSVFLALANFVPPLISYLETRRLSRTDWISVALTVPLLIAGYLMAKLDLRYASDIPPFPPGFSEQLIEAPISKLELVSLPDVSIHSSVPWLLAFLLLIALSLLALRWVWSLRSQPIAALGLLSTLAAALAHQFVLVAAVPVTLLLMKQISIADFRQRPAQIYVGAIVAAVVFWVLYSAASIDWPTAFQSAGGPMKALASFVYQFIQFPNIAGDIAKPFIKAVPWVTLLLVAGLTLAATQQIFGDSALRSPLRILLLLLVLIILGVGVSDPPREETRYVAFLYPLAITIIVAGLSRILMPREDNRRLGTLLGGAVIVMLFVATEDIDYHHIASIDTPETTFRLGMNPSLQSHLEIRDDVRSIAEWLEPQVTDGDTIVIDGVHGFDYYFHDSRYFFIDERNPTFTEFSCRNGSVERWTNLPLIHSFADLKAKTAQYRRVFIVTFTPSTEQMAQLADRRARIVLSRGLVSVVVLEPAV